MFVISMRVSHPAESHRRICIIFSTHSKSSVSLKECTPLRTLATAFGEGDVRGAGWMF